MNINKNNTTIKSTSKINQIRAPHNHHSLGKTLKQYINMKYQKRNHENNTWTK